MLGFKRKKRIKAVNLHCVVDIHSHLLPGLDDGVKTMEESLELLSQFQLLGYSKVITTPHIMFDFYNNSEDDIRLKLKEVQCAIIDAGLTIQLEAAAEYYLDEHLYQRIGDEAEDFLTFGDNYILFETPFMNEPMYLKEFIFMAKSRGFNPVLAHPERYSFVQNDPSIIDDLIDRGVLLQLNINSLSGYYSKQVQKLAEKLIKQQQINFIGSDCHNIHHMDATKKARSTKYYQKALDLSLLNFEL